MATLTHLSEGEKRALSAAAVGKLVVDCDSLGKDFTENERTPRLVKKDIVRSLRYQSLIKKNGEITELGQHRLSERA